MFVEGAVTPVTGYADAFGGPPQYFGSSSECRRAIEAELGTSSRSTVVAQDLRSYSIKPPNHLREVRESPDSMSQLGFYKRLAARFKRVKDKG